MPTLNAQRRRDPSGRSPVHLRHTNYTSTVGSRGAQRHQAYIERADAVVALPAASVAASLREVAPGLLSLQGDPERDLASFGTIAGSPSGRRAFWSEVERSERVGRRVQRRIVAELPSELGAQAHVRAVGRFLAEIFVSRGLPCHAAIHLPGPGGDPRNVHVHIVYYDRPGGEGITGGSRGSAARHGPRAPVSGARYPWGSERPNRRRSRLERQIGRASTEGAAERFRRGLDEVGQFATSGASDVAPIGVDDRPWIALLRAGWCSAVNAELARSKVSKAYHPGRYFELGIHVIPARHVGSAASAMAARGIATRVLDENTAAEVWNQLSDGVPELEVRRRASTTLAEKRATYAESEEAEAAVRGDDGRRAVWKEQRRLALAHLEAVANKTALSDSKEDGSSCVAVAPQVGAQGDLCGPSAKTPALPIVSAVVDKAVPPSTLVSDRTAPARSATPRHTPAAASALCALHPMRGPTMGPPSAPALPKARRAGSTSSSILPVSSRQAPSILARPLRLSPTSMASQRMAEVGSLRHLALHELLARQLATTKALQTVSMTAEDAAGLRRGLRVLGQLVAEVQASPEHRADVKRKVELGEALHDQRAAGAGILSAAGRLEKALPSYHRRLVDSATSEGVPLIFVAAMREQSFARALRDVPSALTAASELSSAALALERNTLTVGGLAEKSGGLGQTRVAMIEDLRRRLWQTTEWIPTLPGEREPIALRLSATLDVGNLPIRSVSLTTEQIRARARAAVDIHRASEAERRRVDSTSKPFSSLGEARGTTKGRDR